MDTWTHGQMDRRTDGQTDREADDRQTETRNHFFQTPGVIKLRENLKVASRSRDSITTLS